MPSASAGSQIMQGSMIGMVKSYLAASQTLPSASLLVVNPSSSDDLNDGKQADDSNGGKLAGSQIILVYIMNRDHQLTP